MTRHLPAAPRPSRAPLLAGIGVGLAVTALVTARMAARAEHSNPPKGRFIEVDGTLLHYVEQGEGPALVLLHGNGSMVQDFTSSGLVAMAARKYRVIVFDRPGYGHSTRPRGRLFTAAAQADLLHKALRQMGVRQATVLGHSWGGLVAASMGLRHPQMVQGLVLASGYFYPTPRIDAAVLAGPALPGIGDVMRYTVTPVVARLLWDRILRRLFRPAPVPAKFGAFPKEMALRPSQLRASAAETGLMLPCAAAMSGAYSSLSMPVSIVAGDDDRLISTDEQSKRLHDDIAHSSFHRVTGAGHMVHQTAPENVLAAIDAVQPGAA